MFSRKLLAGVFLAASVACAPKQAATGAADEAPRPNRDRNLITQGEIEANPSLKASSALDMIRSLRPMYFTDRGTNTITDAAAGSSQDPEAGLVHASINNGRIVSISELAGYHGNEVLEVRFLNAGQAMQKYGTAARAGPIILVTTAKQ